MRAKQPRHLALRLGALLLTAALIVTLAACKKSDGPDETTTAPTTGDASITTAAGVSPISIAEIPAWRIEVRGVPNVTSFSSVDAQYLPKVEVEMTTMNNGFNVTNRYGGVTLRSILNLFYVQNVLSIDAIAMDNRTVTYPSALAMAGDTVLAWEIDGVPIDTQNPLRLCPKTGAADMYMNNLSALNIVPLDGTVTTTIPTTGPLLDLNNNPITAPPTTWSSYTTSIYIPPVTAPTDPTTTTTTTTTNPSRTLRPGFNVGGYTGPPTTTKPPTTAPTTPPVTASTATTSTTYNVFDH